MENCGVSREDHDGARTRSTPYGHGAGLHLSNGYGRKLVPIEFLPWKDADWRQFMPDYPWNEGNRYHRLRRAGTRPDEIACAALAYIRA